MTETDKRLRETVTQTMRDRGITQTQLADSMGVTQGHVSQLVTGERGKIPESLIALLDELGLELTVVERD